MNYGWAYREWQDGEEIGVKGGGGGGRGLNEDKEC